MKMKLKVKYTKEGVTEVWSRLSRRRGWLALLFLEFSFKDSSVYHVHVSEVISSPYHDSICSLCTHVSIVLMTSPMTF